MGEIVKYHNYMNNISLKEFGSEELNMLMALCAKMRDQGTDAVSFTFAEIRKIANLSNCNTKEQFQECIHRIGRKLNSCVGHYEDDDEIVYFTLFPTLRASKKDSVLEVKVNPEFKFVLNDLSSNFTVFELQEFVNLKSKYSKNLYRLLKQYDNKASGWATVPIEELRRKLGCPDSYPNKIFNAKIVDPATNELRSVFDNLTYDVIKARRKGAPVTGYEFRWKPAVNDQLPGQRGFSSTEEFDQLVKDMNPSDRRKVTKVAADIVKGEKKAKTLPNTSFHNFDMKHNYDFDKMEEVLLDRSNQTKE